MMVYRIQWESGNICIRADSIEAAYEKFQDEWYCHSVDPIPEVFWVCEIWSATC